MKKIYSTLTMLALMVAALSFTACGGDDDEIDNGGLSTPKYEAESALYTITDSQSDYKSIEFTASGNYLITMNYYVFGMTRMAEETNCFHGLFAHPIVKTRSYGFDDNIIYGTYTVEGDTYKLDGFGTIVVNGGGSNAVSLDITTKDGEKISLGAQKENQYSSSSMTNSLCRTWKLNKYGIRSTAGGQTVLDETYNSYRDFLRAFYGMEYNVGDNGVIEIGNNASVNLWEGIEKEVKRAPLQAIFTKSGTYVVFYADGTLAVSTWKWLDESAGKARYSWDYDNMYNSYSSGAFSVNFKDDQMVMKEKTPDGFYGSGGIGSDASITLIYYLNEVR